MAIPTKWTPPTALKLLWEWRLGQASAVRTLGRTCRQWPAPARGPPRERQAGRGSSLGSGGALGTLRLADLLADPGSEGGGAGGRHCCGFAAKEGAYLGYLGGRQGSGRAPPASACQHSATGTCHLRNVFIFSQSLARFPPHSSRARRGGQEREGKGHTREQGGWGELPVQRKHRGACQIHPMWLPQPPPTIAQEVAFLPGAWPMRATLNLGPRHAERAPSAQPS